MGQLVNGYGKKLYLRSPWILAGQRAGQSDIIANLSKRGSLGKWAEHTP